MPLKAVLTNLALGLVYALAGIGTLFSAETAGPNLSTMLWIGSGIALSVALLSPFKVWPGVVLGAAVTTWVDGSPWPHVVATGVANGAEVHLAMVLLRRAGFNRRFATARDVLLLVGLACGVAAAVGALTSVASLVLTEQAPPSAFVRIWLMWWLTHAMGMLLVVPTTLIVRGRGAELSRATLGEAAILLPPIAAGAWLSFMAPPSSLMAELFFLPFPLLLLGAVRGDALVASFGGLIVTVIAILGALSLQGPFSTGTPNEALFLTWSFASVTIVATVIATAVVRERTLAQRDLERSERRLRAVLEATSEGILVADEVGRITDVNSAFLDLIGNMGGDSGNRYESVDAFLDRLMPAGEPETPGAPPRVLDADIGPSERVSDELILPDGRVVEAESVPLAGSGVASGRVWSMRDVTQRVASEEERRRLHDQILHSQKLEGLGVLAGGVAHDFNNVLAGIMGYAELLLHQEGLDEAGRADTEGIIKAASHAAGLCGQLLTYAGKTTAVLGPVDLCACAADMRQFMSLSVAKSVELVVELPSEPVLALADEVQIRQVIFNLVQNASEAIVEGPGSGTVRVRVAARPLDRGWLDRAYAADERVPAGTYAVVEVEDDGVGMDEESIGQIFDPFYSSKGTGRGLGLSAVLGVLRSHSGALAVESRSGSGSRFTIALPQSRRPAESSESTLPGREPAEGPGTILVVDDEPVVRETIGRMLKADRHTVLEAGDGDAALQVLEERHPGIDLIVLDLTMPRRDGLSTLTEMRARGYHVPVILASGYSDAAVPPDAAVAGFIQKPFRSRDLRDRVAAVLREGVPRPV